MIKTPLLLLPGLGADARLLEPLREHAPPFDVPAWITPRRRESLPDYAARFSETLAYSPEAILAGVSFGGMVALEMARARPPAGVLLISSCRSHRAVLPRFRRQQALGRLVPAPIARALLAGPITSSVARADRLSPRHTTLLRSMARDADLPFLRWGAHAAAEWKGAPPPGVTVSQIHGRHDAVVPDPHEDAETVIEDAAHLITLTHPERLGRWLAEHTSVPASTPSPAV
jgi:pimeloyl-ACP methyl ester carboxylesterase